MSYSDIIGSISGLLQFAVALYALRVSRLFGMTRVGWLFCSAFSVLAIVHVLLSVHPFGFDLQLGAGVNFFYEVVSVLLLATIAHVEILLRRHQGKTAETRQSQSGAEVKLNAELLEVKKSRDELRLSVTRLQSELDQQKHTREEFHKAHQEELTALRQTEEESLASLGGARAELAQQKLNHELAEARHVEQMAAAHQSEEELRANVAALRTELEQEKQLREQMETAFQGQLAAAQESERALQQSFLVSESHVSQIATIEKELQEKLAASYASEQEWRETAARLQEEAFRQKLMRGKLEQSSRDLLLTFRQSGIHEIAVMAQARVAYIGRLTNLLRDNARRLRKVINGTHRARQLPFSLALLVEHLSDEQFLLLKRIESVRDKTRELQAKMTSDPSQLAATASAEPTPESHDRVVPEPISQEAAASPNDSTPGSELSDSETTGLSMAGTHRNGHGETFAADPNLLQPSRVPGHDPRESDYS